MRCEWGVRTARSLRKKAPMAVCWRQAGPWCLMQWRPLHYKNLLKSHAAFHVYGEHMGKPAIFRPQNKPLCSWTHDRTGSFLLLEPRPKGVGPLTVIKPPRFSQQNRSYIKLKYRGLINKAWAGERKKKDLVKRRPQWSSDYFPLTVMGSAKQWDTFQNMKQMFT